jgi:hypothetical protein
MNAHRIWIGLRLLLLAAAFGFAWQPGRASGLETTRVYLPVAMRSAYLPTLQTFRALSDSTDAELGNLNCTSWTACRSAGYANFWLSDGLDGMVESSYSPTSGRYALKRLALFFDTSGLPDEAAISAATLRIYSGTAQSGTTTLHVVRTTASTPAGPSSFGTFVMASGGSAIARAGQWLEIPLGAQALGWIHKAGFTRLGLVHDLDMSGAAPAGLNYASLAMWERDGLEPELVVTYVAP